MSDQRLSVTFGAFSCDVVGYDDPFTILTRVVELFGEIAKSNSAFGAGEAPMSDMERARLTAGLADQAARIDELADRSTPNGMRYVVRNADNDAPEIAAVDDGATVDEVVIAAQADDAAHGGDLELRDTLEAASTSDPVPEVEVVALDITSAKAVVVEEVPATETPLELTEQIETSVIVDAPADTDEPLVATTAAAQPAMPEDQAVPEGTAAEDTEITVPDAVETVATSDLRETAETAPALTVSDGEPKTDEPATRQSLHLNMKNHGVETKADNAAQAEADADKTETEPQQPQRRVTITKLPLRPEPPKKADQTETPAKHMLTPVQKVEPVVTFGEVISDSAEEAPAPSRAERIRANMEKRTLEDDGGNFLFSDVDEVQQHDIPADPEAAENQTQSETPLILETVSPQASPPLEEPAKKPRRSIANLLGFRKNTAVAPESATEIPAPNAQANDNYSGDSDGFVRLRESVAAAMPATDEPTVRRPTAPAKPESISDAIDYDDETSPTAFARRVGANSLQDLLEASAVYMDVVEGKSRFSRRDVMQALNQIGAENDYTQEARLKSFRKLLTTGSLVRVDDGMFTVSQSTRFGYETRLQA